MNSRETIVTHKIALLATGDEIVHGDILNSNARDIAKRLYDLGMHVGMHAVTADTIVEIETAILFLLEHHDALIITGGLGPTSDDLTRYALSKASHQALVFHEPTWQEIVNRLQKFGYSVPPESNRQQALFPQDAVIIPNANGTAAGCTLTVNNKIIFMLPGPPVECIPMVEEVVIPQLKQRNFSQVSFNHSWLLFGVSEGQIAEELDALAKPFACMTGYRLAYPYLEFKIHSVNESDFIALKNLVENNIQPYLISEGTKTASDLLIKNLEENSVNLQIDDQATGGLLESIIKTPKTVVNLSFVSAKDFTASAPSFKISGLDEYWEQNTSDPKTTIHITYTIHNQTHQISQVIPLRGERVKRYAVEWLAWQINQIVT